MIENGTIVNVNYVGKFVDGSVFDTSEGNGLLRFEIGSGQIIPGFERALIGKNIGDKITVEIEPELGYGLVNEELIAKIPKERVPEGVHVGQELQSVLENGQPITVLITEVNNDDVVIDANHPLAGKDLIFDIEIVSLG
jgi:FKBP-type peptidyl-prolyl cis-trans isomerase 2